MKRYIQITNWYITDCISYEFGDYIEIELEKVPTGFISWIYKYENWAIILDEEKKAIQDEEIRKEEEEIEKQEEESKTNWVIQGFIKELKEIERIAMEKKLEWETAQEINDEDVRFLRLQKIEYESVEIRNRYNALIKILKEDFWLLAEDIV